MVRPLNGKKTAMKIYDCFMFFDEEMLLDLRLNIMDKYVDKFVITEATYMHNGNPKELIFDINKFYKFKDKIIYIVVDKQPPDLFKINESDNNKQDTRGQKLILNGYKRDNYQRQMAQQILDKIEPEDWIMINDIDEIPNLKHFDLRKIKNKLVFFKQQIFFYKFNLLYSSNYWFGSRACKKKNFISPQWLRDLKCKKYPLWRLDIIFSKKKYNDIFYIDDGGWHFTNIKSPEDIEKKTFKTILIMMNLKKVGLILKICVLKLKKKKFYMIIVQIKNNISGQVKQHSIRLNYLQCLII